ncbi:MAG: hypothetical protein JWM78_1746 [Verrucomicrobiaceae bacterium]|nr:hypothetical protein [Verrucomicrobiaceae bacterium]
MCIARLPAYFTTVSLSVALAACGGGGGGSSSTPPPVTQQPVTATFPIAQAYANQVTNGFQLSFNVSGKTGGVNFSGNGTLTVAAAVAASFENQTAMMNTTTISGTVSANGGTAPLNSVVRMFVDSNYKDLGSVDEDDGTYTVVNSYTPLPTAAHVNDSGSLSTSTVYSDQSKSLVVGSSVLTYVISPDSDTSVIYDITEKDYDASHTLTQTTHERYRITTNAAVSFASADYQSADGQDTEHLVPQ